MPIDLEHPFIEALIKKYEADIADGTATALVYLKSPVGIGEHPQFISELDKAILKIRRKGKWLTIQRRNQHKHNNPKELF